MRTVCVSFCDLTLVLSYWYASDRFDLSILRTFYSIAIYSCFGTKRDFDLITPDILLSLVSVSSVVFDNLWYKLGEYPKQWKNSFLSWNNRMCIGKSAQASRTGSDYTTLTFPSIQTLLTMPIANQEKHPDCLFLWSRDTIPGNQMPSTSVEGIETYTSQYIHKSFIILENKHRDLRSPSRNGRECSICPCSSGRLFSVLEKYYWRTSVKYPLINITTYTP